MKTATKNGHKSSEVPENAYAKQALENIAKIENEAKARKLEQLEA